MSKRLLFNVDGCVHVVPVREVPNGHLRVDQRSHPPDALATTAATLRGLASKLNDQLDERGMGDAGHYFTDDGTEPICMDCAQYGERTGHQECQYPEDHG
jgi:hypothetical protein